MTIENPETHRKRCLSLMLELQAALSWYGAKSPEHRRLDDALTEMISAARTGEQVSGSCFELQLEPDFHFGACPECGCDRIVDVGRHHYGVCEQHLAFWYIGSDLFSSWREQTPEQKAEAIALLRPCHEVEAIIFKHEIRGAQHVGL